MSAGTLGQSNNSQFLLLDEGGSAAQDGVGLGIILPAYASNTLAKAAGLVAGQFYVNNSGGFYYICQVQ